MSIGAYSHDGCAGRILNSEWRVNAGRHPEVQENGELPALVDEALGLLAQPFEIPT